MAAETLTVITLFATLLGFGVLVNNVTKKLRISSIFFLLITGLLLGPTFFGWVDVSRMGDVPDFLRILSLIIIVFAGSFHLKLSTLKKVSNMALKLSFVGFLFSTIVLGLFAHYIFDLSWISSFILGSIIGGTSTEVLSSFKDTLKNNETLDLLTVESLFNSPLSVLIPLVLLDIIVAGGIATSTFYIAQFWQLLAAGVGTGVLVGLAAGKIFRTTEKEISPIMGIAIALVTYALAQNVGGSGILAVALAGMFIGNLRIPHKKLISEFDDTFSVLLTISIFTLLGAQISLQLSSQLVFAEAIFLALVIFITRPLFVIFTLYKEKSIPFRDMLFIAFEGPRGVAAAAMAALPLSVASVQGLTILTQEAELILVTTFLVILFTVLSGTIAGMLYSKSYSLLKEEGEQITSLLEGDDTVKESDTYVEI